MRFFKLKTSLLAFILSVVVLSLHLGSGYLFHAVLKNVTLANFWQHSLSIYWPALLLARFFGPIAFSSPLMSVIVMIAAGLIEWWIIFASIIWAIRFYFREPPISPKQKLATITVALIVATCFYKFSPEALGDPRSPLEKMEI